MYWKIFLQNLGGGAAAPPAPPAADPMATNNANVKSSIMGKIVALLLRILLY